MTLCRSLASLLLCAAASAARAQEVRISAQLDRTSFYLGEGVPVHVTIENRTSSPLQVPTFGAVEVDLVGPQGQTFARPPEPMIVSTRFPLTEEVPPGESRGTLISPQLTDAFDIAVPGRYRIRVTAGHWAAAEGFEVTDANCTVTFKVPTAARARKIVEDLERRRTGLVSLHSQIYVPILSERALAGDVKAIQGFNSISGPAAAEALIDIGAQAQGALAVAVAQALTNRRGAYGQGILPRVQALARRWLALSDLAVCGSAIRLLDRRGGLTASDAPRLEAILTTCLAEWPNLELASAWDYGVPGRQDPRDDAAYAANMCANALDSLAARGAGVFEGPIASEAVAYAYFHSFRNNWKVRPAKWKTVFYQHVHDPIPGVAASALYSIPEPVSAEFAAVAESMQDDPNPQIRRAAHYVLDSRPPGQTPTAETP